MTSYDEKIRVSFLLPKELFERLEERSRKSFLGRSAWIIQAINEKINKEEEQEKSKEAT